MERNNDRQNETREIKIMAFCNVTQCSVAYRERFDRMCSLHLQDYSPLMRSEASTSTVKRKEIDL
jgi:hypothetical protein